MPSFPRFTRERCHVSSKWQNQPTPEATLCLHSAFKKGSSVLHVLNLMVPGSTKLSCPAGRGNTEIWHLEPSQGRRHRPEIPQHPGGQGAEMDGVTQSGREQRWMGHPGGEGAEVGGSPRRGGSRGGWVTQAGREQRWVGHPGHRCGMRQHP